MKAGVPLIAKPFLCELVAAVVETMGGAFPELKVNPAKAIKAIEKEEEQFIRTLDRGIKLFQKIADKVRASGQKIITGADAFELHDTFGIYIDITQQMAQEEGLRVDVPGFEAAMNQHRMGSSENESTRKMFRPTNFITGSSIELS